jgi:hypothetical protein
MSVRHVALPTTSSLSHDPGNSLLDPRPCEYQAQQLQKPRCTKFLNRGAPRNHQRGWVTIVGELKENDIGENEQPVNILAWLEGGIYKKPNISFHIAMNRLSSSLHPHYSSFWW